MYHSLIGGSLVPINLRRKTFSAICVMLMVSMIFQTVATQIEVYTEDDNGLDISIMSGQEFNVSLEMGGMYIWEISTYDSSVLIIIEDGYWSFSPNPGSSYYHNWTFEGKGVGITELTFHHKVLGGGDNTIDDTFTLNVIVIKSDQPLNPLLMLGVVIIIAVVPSLILIKWMKGERKDEN